MSLHLVVKQREKEANFAPHSLISKSINTYYQQNRNIFRFYTVLHLKSILQSLVSMNGMIIGLHELKCSILESLHVLQKIYESKAYISAYILLQEIT